MSCASPPPPAGALAPGFRFHPTDEELVSYYLKRKVTGRPLRVDAISEIDIYKSDPWDLPGRSRIQSRDMEWYFFSSLDKKYANRSRTNRGTGSGYWKTTGKDRPVCCRRGRTVGVKKTLVYHVGRAPKGQRTNWVMHEYRLEDEELLRAGIPQDAFVVCRIVQKRAPGAQNGAQCGAEFIDEEWEDDKAPILEVEDGEGTLIAAECSVNKETGDCENQHLVVQDKNTALVMETDGQVDLYEFVDSGSLPKLCQEQGFNIDVDGNDDVPEEHNSRNLNGLGGYSAADDSNKSLTVLKDAHLELSNLIYQMDHNAVGDLACRGAIRKDQNFVNDGISWQQELQDMEDHFSTSNQNNDLSKPFPLFEAGENNYDVELDDLMGTEPGEFSSGEPGDDGIPFFNTPSYYPNADHGLTVEVNNFMDLSMAKSNGTDVVDELFSCFDATENIQSSDLDRESRTLSSSQSKMASMVNEGNAQACQASPQPSQSGGGKNSSFLIKDSGKHSSIKDADAHVELGKQSDNRWDKALPNSLVPMLGAISSPPALASEYPTKAHASSSIRITAGWSWIDGVTVSSNGKGFCCMQKNSDVGFVLQCGATTRKDVIGNLVSLEAMPKTPRGAAAFVLRNSFYLLFLSVLFLATTLRVGFFIYTR